MLFYYWKIVYYQKYIQPSVRLCILRAHSTGRWDGATQSPLKWLWTEQDNKGKKDDCVLADISFISVSRDRLAKKASEESPSESLDAVGCHCCCELVPPVKRAGAAIAARWWPLPVASALHKVARCKVGGNHWTHKLAPPSYTMWVGTSHAEAMASLLLPSRTLGAGEPGPSPSSHPPLCKGQGPFQGFACALPLSHGLPSLWLSSSQ